MRRRDIANSRISISGTGVFVALLTVLVAANVAAIGFQLTRPWPLTPWESGSVVDACRLSMGEAIYTEEQATWMYGPVTLYVNSWLYRLTGPSLLAGRLITLVCSLLLFTAIATLVNRGAGWFAWLVTFGLLLTTHLSSLSYMVDPRPDFAALLFCLAFLVSYFRGVRGDRRWFLAGLACLVLAVFMKQTSAAFSVVPFMAVALFSRDRLKPLTGWLVAPPLVIVVAVAVVSQVSEIAFRQMFEVPRLYPLRFEPALWIKPLLAYTPFLVLLFASKPLGNAGDDRDSELQGWLSITCLVTLASSLLVISKRGGDLNAFLPAWISVIALVGLNLPSLFAWSDDAAARRSARILRGATMCVVLLLAVFVNFSKTVPRALWWYHGNASRAAVIAAVVDLPGRTICPEDPTIPLFAFGATDRSMVFELDASGWQPTLPENFQQDIEQAEWLVRVNSVWNDVLFHRWMNEELLKKLGFRRVTRQPFDNGYELWRNTSATDR